MSSILYAERIQKAVLPPFDYFYDVFPEAFIVFKPKDIVSGDFFWIAEISGKKMIAVADCTGHGVPGAFMSMLGIVLLNEIVNKHQDLNFEFQLTTNQILDLLRMKLKKSLHQKGVSGEANDGLDISLCIIDYDTKELHFSGANMPIYIANSGKVIKYSGDRMPIGIYTEKDSDFSTFTHNLAYGDTLYMATDGYSDQFGGPIDKKFLVKNFREMLASISELSMDKQQEIVGDIFEGWKGIVEQTDDISVVGIKVL
jgi:serine phosphatase RsbU (regulator of sigma subunit)